jgi:hypothetical protein
MNLYEIVSWMALGFVPTLGALGIFEMRLAREERRQAAIRTEA